MPPSVKENEVLTVRPDTAQRTAPSAGSNGDASIKQQPVALEVPVTVNGARSLEGSDKREPFSETTKTVLVFGNGAVIRLSSSVAPGQLLFLTNEKTKKEVVCQVVKSKNYRNVSGYVELEFTESVVGFWGMRFPSDRIGSAPPPAPPAPVSVGSPVISRPSAPSVATTDANVTPSALSAKPAVPISVAKNPEPKLAGSKPVIPAAPKVEEPVVQKPVAPVAPLSSTLSTSFDPEASLAPRSKTPPEPVAPAVPAPPVSATSDLSVSFPPANPTAPASLPFDAPRASEAQASFLEPAKTPAAPMTSVPNLLSLFEAKPASPGAESAPLVQVSADPETETLKHHTARLQEQLSSMQFSGAPETPATVSVQIPHAPPVVIQKELADHAAKVLEMSRTHEAEPAPAIPVEPVKLEPLPLKSSLADEELKIPAWLEPLARNATAPSSTQELIEREKAKRLAEQSDIEETAAPTVVAPMEEHYVPELPLPTFSDTLPVEEEKSTRQNRSRSSNKGLWIGAIAAGVLLLAGGGWWYMQLQSSGVHVDVPPVSNVQASVISSPVESLHSQPQVNAQPQVNPPVQANPAVLTNASSKSNAAPNAPSAVPASAPAATARNSHPTSKSANPGAATAASVAAQPVAEQPKKPILGEVHLAAPKVSSSRRTQNGADPDPGIVLSNDEQPEPGAEALNAGLVGGSAQPSAPVALPVGGDVKQAKLISAVPPVYPTLAKIQHVSGNVLVDALIDANGRVTTMKILSGPTLLHQAAMDALKQWRYQAATLDGKPVPMHLTVTIQFRLQ